MNYLVEALSGKYKITIEHDRIMNKGQIFTIGDLQFKVLKGLVR